MCLHGGIVRFLERQKGPSRCRSDLETGSGPLGCVPFCTENVDGVRRVTENDGFDVYGVRWLTESDGG